jgi:hypothetical protein
MTGDGVVPAARSGDAIAAATLDSLRCGTMRAAVQVRGASAMRDSAAKRRACDMGRTTTDPCSTDPCCTNMAAAEMRAAADAWATARTSRTEMRTAAADPCASANMRCSTANASAATDMASPANMGCASTMSATGTPAAGPPLCIRCERQNSGKGDTDRDDGARPDHGKSDHGKSDHG